MKEGKRAMKRRSIGARHEMIVQPTFIIGTYNEDGTPDFAPITWVSKTCEKDCDYLIVISMYGTKKTKQNVRRTGRLSINLASTDMLELVDYFGQTSGAEGPKDALFYTFSRAVSVDAPTLDASRWVCECEVKETVTTGESDTFFCRIKNVQIDERIDVDTKGIDLTAFDPVIYSGNYHSIGRFLGAIGDFYHKAAKILMLFFLSTLFLTACGRAEKARTAQNRIPVEETGESAGPEGEHYAKEGAGHVTEEAEGVLSCRR